MTKHKKKREKNPNEKPIKISLPFKEALENIPFIWSCLKSHYFVSLSLSKTDKSNKNSIISLQSV